MAGPVFYDRVRESSITLGTGALSLIGAATGFRTFSSVMTVNDKTYYVVAALTTADWEVGIGTYSANAISRDTVLASSNAGSLVNFVTGTKDVFLDAPAASLLTPIVVNKAANYTATQKDYFLAVDCTAGVVTITLPPATTRAQLTVKKVDGTTNAVTIARAGADTIDNTTTATLTAQYDSYSFISDGGTKWWIL